MKTKAATKKIMPPLPVPPCFFRRNLMRVQFVEDLFAPEVPDEEIFAAINAIRVADRASILNNIVIATDYPERVVRLGRGPNGLNFNLGYGGCKVCFVVPVYGANDLARLDSLLQIDAEQEVHFLLNQPIPTTKLWSYEEGRRLTVSIDAVAPLATASWVSSLIEHAMNTGVTMVLSERVARWPAVADLVRQKRTREFNPVVNATEAPHLI